MKLVLILTLLFLALPMFGQQTTLEQWNEEARTNIRLLPRYGHVQKTEAQRESDRQFIETMLKQDTTHRRASNHLIELGFKYLNRDIKTAMYRFNQAYLLDSTNTDIYWGYGAVYMVLGDYVRAAHQYIEGVALDPNNTHLLTDYGTYHMVQYNGLQTQDETKAAANLDSAISYLLKSFSLNPKNQNTSFKLSICYYNKKDCENAWKYYDICKELGGQPITEEYSVEIKKTCEKQD